MVRFVSIQIGSVGRLGARAGSMCAIIVLCMWGPWINIYSEPKVSFRVRRNEIGERIIILISYSHRT